MDLADRFLRGVRYPQSRQIPELSRLGRDGVRPGDDRLEAMTVAAVASRTIGSRLQSWTMRKNGLLTLSGSPRISAPWLTRTAAT